MTVRQKTLRALKRILPKSMYTALIVRRAGFPEPELALIPRLCHRSRVSVDVGAAYGVYTRHMLLHSKECVIFEPRPDAAQNLEALLTNLTTPVRVENIALSDFAGEITLNICVEDGGLSTIEPRNPIAGNCAVRQLAVMTARLDDFEFRYPVGLIKIDVEGHEEAVVRGSAVTLERDHPNLIIEIEERHNPGAIRRVFSLLYDVDYTGYFYSGGMLNPVTNLDVHEDQDVERFGSGVSRYINNFIFLSPSNRIAVNDLISNGN